MRSRDDAAPPDAWVEPVPPVPAAAGAYLTTVGAMVAAGPPRGSATRPSSSPHARPVRALHRHLLRVGGGLERDLGITQRVLVAPVARSAVILGKAAGAGVRAGVHVGIVLGIVAVARIPLRWSVPAVVGTLAFSILGATLFSSVSMVIASVVRSREQFMGLGQLITLPLLFASNALYTVSLVPGWLQGLARANPLTYQVEAVRRLLVGVGPDRLLVGAAVLVACTRSPSRWRRVPTRGGSHERAGRSFNHQRFGERLRGDARTVALDDVGGSPPSLTLRRRSRGQR